MNFKLFLEKTISDILNAAGEDIKLLKKQIRDFLQTQLTGRDLDVAVNLFSYIYYQEGKGNIIEDWDKLKDYLKENLSTNRNIFVNPITRAQLEELNDKYHLSLKISEKNLRKGPKGEDLIDVSKELIELNKIIKLPNDFRPNLWSGWKWVSLGCGYSSEEAAAGGHCGNIGNESGDNIFSLRNPNSQVVLTFIVNVNTGAIGESKANNNEKPKRELHPAIVALLSSKYVKKIEGGGYLPEKNFELEDLKYSEELYNYFKSHLEGNKEHKTPENYLPLSWLNSLSNELIHVKYPNIEDKIKLLGDILNVFTNYKVFDLDDQQKFNMVVIKLDLDKLVRDVVNSASANRVKYLLDIYGKVVNIYSSNKVWHKEDLQYYNPRNDNEEIETDSEGLIKNYIKKNTSVKIDQSTVEFILNKILSKKLNLRDKSNLVSLTQRATGGLAYRENSGNLFNDTVNRLIDQIVDESLEMQQIPSYLRQDILEYIEHHLESARAGGAGIHFNSKKQTLEIIAYKDNLYYGEKSEKEKKIIKSEIDKIYNELKYEFIKKGIPADAVHVYKLITNCIGKDFFQNFIDKVSKTLVANYRIYQRKQNRHFFRTFNIKKILQDIKENKNLDIVKKMQYDIEDCRDRVFSKVIKNIKKFILGKIETICDCVKSQPDFKIKNTASDYPGRRHKNKNRPETPDQLRKERERTQRSQFKALMKKLESERMQNFSLPTRKEDIYTRFNFKKWLIKS